MYDASFEAGSRLVVGRLLHYYGIEQAAGGDGEENRPGIDHARGCTKNIGMQQAAEGDGEENGMQQPVDVEGRKPRTADAGVRIKQNGLGTGIEQAAGGDAEDIGLRRGVQRGAGGNKEESALGIGEIRGKEQAGRGGKEGNELSSGDARACPPAQDGSCGYGNDKSTITALIGKGQGAGMDSGMEGDRKDKVPGTLMEHMAQGQRLGTADGEDNVPAPDAWCGWHSDNSTITGLIGERPGTGMDSGMERVGEGDEPDSAPTVFAPDAWCGWHNDNSTITGLVPALWLNEETGVPVAAPEGAGLYVEGRDGVQVRVAAPPDALGFQIGEAAQESPRIAPYRPNIACQGPKRVAKSRIVC